MLTRIAILTSVLFCASTIAEAQMDGAAGGATGATGTTTGTTTQSGTGSTTGTGNASNGTGLSSQDFSPNTGAVNSEMISNTVETGRTSGLSSLGGSTLANTTGGGGNTLPGGSQFGGNQRGIQNRGTQRGGATSSRSIRPSLRLGFTPIVRPSADVSRSVSRRFSRITSRRTQITETKPELRNVRILAGKEGLLTLTGSVPTAAAKRLAANMLRMEPGVRSVQNNLTVAAAPTR